MTIQYRMYLKFLLKLRCLGWFQTGQAFRREASKVEFLSKDNFVRKRFRLSLSIPLNFSFPYESFIGVFFNLLMQNFGLENHRMANKREPFC